MLFRSSPDSDDGRGKNATLTGSGRRLLETVAPLHVEDVQRIVFDHLSTSETANLATALSKVAAEPKPAPAAASSSGDAPVKRGRGRPPKAK